MITIYKQPTNIIATGNENWFLFQSTLMDMNTPPEDLYLEVNLFDKIFLIPTSAYSTGLIGFNPSPILNDYVEKDFIKQNIPGVSYVDYDFEVHERFSGLYVTFSLDQNGTTYSTSTFSVVNNDSLTQIPVGAIISKSGFVDNSTSDIIYIKGTGYSGEYVDKVFISSSPTASVPVKFNLSNNTYGYIQLEDYPVVSYGGSFSIENKWALLSSQDYLSLNYDDNFNGYKIGATGAGFLTKSPKDVYMKSDEIYSLSFIVDVALTGINYSMIDLNVETSLGVISSTISLPERITFHTIDVSPNTLGITSSTYSVWLSFEEDNRKFQSSRKNFNLGCYGTKDVDNIRLAWLNELGGIDFYTFKFIETHSKVANKSTFNKSIWDETYVFSRKNHEKTNYRVESYDTFLVVSGLIDYDTNIWLSSIIKSKWVWWYRNNEWVAIVINTNSLEVSTYRNDLELKIEFSLSKSNIN